MYNVLIRKFSMSGPSINYDALGLAEEVSFNELAAGLILPLHVSPSDLETSSTTKWCTTRLR